ncbi:MAG TPA: type I-C CRISPR-associated protein Cas5c [Prolixibacteraceae bacterium]|nr:type I-C CRISPR-associated protein Cas5c [Prolixibacteraceae bacterium]HQN93766.1 type I-C CRISPR-associated protein Cas5c [Prolixibacteraceae bacterium]
MEYYNKQFCIEVWGDYACFTRPEMKVERVSYDVITPSAARAVFEAIFWKPAIQWKVKKIEVLNPIRWISVRRNEVGKLMSPQSKQIFIDEPGSRQQRAGLFLRDVAYRLYAEMDFIPLRNRNRFDTPDELKDQEEETIQRSTENPGKYHAMFERRAKKGQCFNQPYLGCREFSCNFRLIENPNIAEKRPIEESRDLGFMLYDMDFTDEKDPKPMFFRVQLVQGVIEVPPIDSGEVRK